MPSYRWATPRSSHSTGSRSWCGTSKLHSGRCKNRHEQNAVTRDRSPASVYDTRPFVVTRPNCLTENVVQNDSLPHVKMSLNAETPLPSGQSMPRRSRDNIPQGDRMTLGKLLLERSSTLFHFIEQALAFASQDRNVANSYSPNEVVVDRRILVSQLVAEVHDAPSLTD